MATNTPETASESKASRERQSRRARANKRALTLQEIADLAGTTKSTVSRVLSDSPRISKKTKERVAALVQEHGFTPNYMARALARCRTGVMGVLTSNISSGFFAEVIRGIDLAAGERRRHLLVSVAHGDEDYFRLFDHLRSNGQVDGIVLLDPPLQLFDRALPKEHLPLVLCASQAPAAARTWGQVDSVTVDNSSTMTRIVRHLAEQGLTQLVHLAGYPNNFDAEHRRSAFEEATRALNLGHCRVLTGHLIKEDGRDAMRKTFSDPSRWPDAFVAFNDSVALGALDEIRRAASAAKKPVAVTGWDNSPAAEVLDLTSAEMPLTGLGETSGSLLQERIEHATEANRQGRQVVLDMKLHIRASSRPSKSDREGKGA